MADLLTFEEVPPEFEYPAEFIRVVELGLLHLEPWHILEGEALRERHQGLSERYPDLQLIPFAGRQDTDDVACWAAEGGQDVLIVHDFASPGYEIESRLADFNDWLRRAVEDLIDFGV